MDDYGPVPEEPATLVPGETARVKFRLPNGKKTVRKLYSTNTVKELYATVQGLLLSDEDTKTHALSGFDLMMGYPPTSLSKDMDKTVQDASVANQIISVTHKNEFFTFVCQEE